MKKLSVYKKIGVLILSALFIVSSLFDSKLLPLTSVHAATSYYVATTGNDSNPGTFQSPFKTINKAAQVANPGDTVYVREGTYRERVFPLRGGTSENARITYQNYNGETVYIKGSELVANWVDQGNGTYKATLSSSLFGSYNPYTIALQRKTNRTLGEVYLNGTPLNEVDAIANVAATPNSWKASTDGLSIYANFNGVNPLISAVEINARRQVFAPLSSQYNLGYITVKGFIVEHAANQYPYMFWDDSYTSMYGAISTTGGHDWIIEDCTVRYAKSIGIVFGYEGGEALVKAGYTLPPANNLIGEMFDRIGYDIIRNNTVSDCGSSGITGMWGPFTKIQGNKVEYNNRMKFSFNNSDYEFAGIKTHYFMDGLIQDNLIRNNDAVGVWVDNMYTRARISGNIFMNNNDYGDGKAELYTEMGFGPLMIDTNVFINNTGGTIVDVTDSEGTVFAHNLFQGNSSVQIREAGHRLTNLFTPHSVDFNNCYQYNVDTANNVFYNNMFIESNMVIPAATANVYNNISDYNVFLDGAQMASGYDTHSLRQTAPSNFSYTSNASGVSISYYTDSTAQNVNTSTITNTYLGYDLWSGGGHDTIDLAFEGAALRTPNPLPGPFASLNNPGTNDNTLWPKSIRTLPERYPTTFKIVNDNKPSIVYTGTWTYSPANTRLFGDKTGDVHASTINNNYFTHSFYGTGIEYIGQKNSFLGNVDIYIDNVFQQTVSCYNATRIVQQSIYKKTGLPLGNHTIKAVKKSATYISLDCLYVYD